MIFVRCCSLCFILGFVASNAISTNMPAYAWGDNLIIKTGQGDEIQFKKGLFGSKDDEIKDRNGDGYEQKKGWFGTKETNAALLGNEVQSKKGWFGSSELQGKSMFGDTVQSKKGWLGHRTTTVDLSGTTGVVESLMGSLGKRNFPPPLIDHGQGGTSDHAPGPGLSTDLPPELQGNPSVDSHALDDLSTTSTQDKP